MTTTANAPEKTASAATTAQVEREPSIMRKRIGSTIFIVSVHFSQSGKETITDKIFRMIEREAKEIA